MILAFENYELRAICEINEIAVETYGDKIAFNLQKRLSDLESANNIYEIPIGDIRPVEKESANYQIDINETYRIIFRQNHPRAPIKDGIIDWEKVNRIQLLKIVNKHEYYS